MIDAGGDRHEFFFEIRVIVPVVYCALRPAPYLNETNAAFDETPGHEPARAEISCGFSISAVKSESSGGFRLEVECFWSAELQARREFVGSNTGFQDGISGPGLSMGAIQFLEEMAAGDFAFVVNEIYVGRSQIVDGPR